MNTDRTEEELDQDWENRVLCNDEACIGVIGPDGQCKECGLPYQGELPQSLIDDSDERKPPQPETEESPSPAAAVDDDEQSDDEWAQRKLCSDEACIGVIGPDGRCKECGRPHET